VISDGTWTKESGDCSTVDAAIASALRVFSRLNERERQNIQVISTPYEGYRDNYTPGKGSALKMIYDEMQGASACMLILLDGDLRNDIGIWHRVFADVESTHRQSYGTRPFFVTAKYARHFVDASLSRFVVGPLTTLMGKFVPGGISGDIVLSNSAVVHERNAVWTDERRKYGTDICTTFDNIADPNTVIYEVYLGAKLHEITDEAKLSVMPGEVIGAALERLLHWEKADKKVTRCIRDTESLLPLEIWDAKRTGIDFMDPGYTDVFDVDVKIRTLLDKFPEFEQDILKVQGNEFHASLCERIHKLSLLKNSSENHLGFLEITQDTWINILYKAIAYAFVTNDIIRPKRCLNFLYTAAFLEFVKDKLADLGYFTLNQIRNVQHHLGVRAEKAREFYIEVDNETSELAMKFYKNRKRILELMKFM
jgi:hypothetical protein